MNEISITQSTSLHPGNKVNDYPDAFQLDEELIQFIKRSGDNKKECRILSRTKLITLMQEGESADSKLARELFKILYQNPNKIAIQSVRMAKRINVNMVAKPYTIRYFKKTGKVSVAWVVRTTETYEMLKLAIMAPANDVVKRNILRDALRKNEILVKRALEELANQGIVIAEWWN